MQLSEDQYELLLQHFRREFLPRNYHFLKAGQISEHKAYINSGSMRKYVVNEKGQEHILSFLFEDWWAADYESYHTGQPGSQYFQAIEDCELLLISKIDFERLSGTDIPQLKLLWSQKQNRMIFSTLSHLTEVKSMTPEERYLNLLHKHPGIFKRIPLKYIAAYLGIEPQSLSRIRKRLSGPGIN